MRQGPTIDNFPNAYYIEAVQRGDIPHEDSGHPDAWDANNPWCEGVPSDEWIHRPCAEAAAGRPAAHAPPMPGRVRSEPASVRGGRGADGARDRDAMFHLDFARGGFKVGGLPLKLPERAASDAALARETAYAVWDGGTCPQSAAFPLILTENGRRSTEN